MREKHDKALETLKGLGITPACAGKTYQAHLVISVARDHPRVCGKNYRKLVSSMSLLGSPPRVREKPSSFCSCSSWYRITPACAGKTMLSGIAQCGYWDHPRVCGKNLTVPKLWSYIKGSPPRVREKH